MVCRGGSDGPSRAPKRYRAWNIESRDLRTCIRLFVTSRVSLVTWTGEVEARVCSLGSGRTILSGLWGALWAGCQHGDGSGELRRGWRAGLLKHTDMEAAAPLVA